MQVDVNERKSRAFNLLLRFFHLGLQIFIASYISKIDNASCSQTFHTICLPISYILLILNLLAIVIIRCRDNFNRTLFFVVLGANAIMAAVTLIMGFAGIGESNSCANNKIIHRFAGFEGLICLLVGGIILKAPFETAQRYTNSPGNAVWIFLFLGFHWTHSFAGGFITIGIFYLLISLSSLIVNILPFFLGITTRMTKILSTQWIGCLALMLICQIVALALYLSNSDSVEFVDIVGKKLLETYLPINIIDGIFWAYGLLTLAYANGDLIRDNIFTGQEDDKFQEEREEGGNYNMGTLK